MKEFPPFYIGQKVVCLIDEPKVGVKKGDVYTVDKYYKLCCVWIIETKEVISPINYTGYCKHHGIAIFVIQNKPLPFESTALAPVEHSFQSIELEKVIEIETPLICVN